MYKKLVALLFVMPFFAQNVYSDVEETDTITDTTEDEQSTNTKSDDVDKIEEKIKRKNFLQKEIEAFSNRISSCKDNNELQKLSETFTQYQDELFAIKDEETSAGMTFLQRKCEAHYIKNKSVGEINNLIGTLKGRRKEFEERQKIAKDRLQRENKKTSPKESAILREDLNNINLGIINLDAKIKELEGIVPKLKAEKCMELTTKSATLQAQLEKLKSKFPPNIYKREEIDKEELVAKIKTWRDDMQRVSNELTVVMNELEQMTIENNGVPLA